MALSGKENPFINGLREKAPVAGTKTKKFEKFPLAGNSPSSNENEGKELPEIQVPESRVAKPTKQEKSEPEPPKNQVPEIKVPKKQVAEESLCGQTELPKIQVPEFWVTKSYETEQSGGSFFRLNQAEAFKLLQELEAGEFKLFLFLSMRAYGWDGKLKAPGDGTVRASVTYAAQGTGISQSSTDKYFATLSKRGLIAKESVSFKKGNCYRVAPVLLTPEKKAELPGIQVPENKAPEFNVTSYPKNKQLVTQNSGTNIDIRNIDSLSLYFQKLEDYFTSIKAPKKKRDEREALVKIKQDNPELTDEQLWECFAFTQSVTLKGNQRVDKPFVYLAGGLLDEALKKANERIKWRSQAEPNQTSMLVQEDSYEVSDEEKAAILSQIKKDIGLSIEEQQP